MRVNSWRLNHGQQCTWCFPNVAKHLLWDRFYKKLFHGNLQNIKDLKSILYFSLCFTDFKSSVFNKLKAIIFHVKKLSLHQAWVTLQWHHNDHNGVSNHQPHHSLLNHLFRCKSKKISKLRVTGLCAGNLCVIVKFPAQRASNMEDVSIWWCHHDTYMHWKNMTLDNSLLPVQCQAIIWSNVPFC